jgi:hypothetical protein
LRIGNIELIKKRTVKPCNLFCNHIQRKANLIFNCKDSEFSMGLKMKMDDFYFLMMNSSIGTRTFFMKTASLFLRLCILNTVNSHF